MTMGAAGYLLGGRFFVACIDVCASSSHDSSARERGREIEKEEEQEEEEEEEEEGLAKQAAAPGGQ
jgi:ribosomal protein L12E/L44/L45/RPP1/RPP2